MIWETTQCCACLVHSGLMVHQTDRPTHTLVAAPWHWDTAEKSSRVPALSAPTENFLSNQKAVVLAEVRA
jgi:hypothetical protein